MKKSLLILTIFVFVFVSCKKNTEEKAETVISIPVKKKNIEQQMELPETSNKQENIEKEEPVIEREPIQVKHFTEEDRYFSLDGGYSCDVYSGLYGIYLNSNKLTYEINEEVQDFTDFEEEISFINKNGIDFMKLNRKFPKELTVEYRFGDSKDVQTDDKILFLAGKTETLDNFLYAYTKGFKTSSFTKNRTNELYFCLYKNPSSWLVENGKEYPLDNLHNRNLETPWIEGVPGDGIGEGFTLVNNNGDITPTLLLMNGYISFDKPYLYEQNNRIKKIKVKGLKSGKEKILDVIDTPHPQTVDISFITEIEDIRVEIVEVYKGTKYDDTCLQYCSLFLETVIPYKSK